MSVLKRFSAMLLAMVMLVSVAGVSGFAAEKDRTIALSLIFRDSQNSEEFPANATVKSGEEFEVAVHFAENPTTPEDTISSVAVFVAYDASKMELSGEGYYEDLLSQPQFNPNRGQNGDTIYFNWYSMDGIVVSQGSGRNKTNVIQEEGNLIVLLFKAKSDLSVNTLQDSVSVIDGVLEEIEGQMTEVRTALTDKATNKFKLSGIRYVLNPQPESYAITYPAAANGNSVTGPQNANADDPVTLNVVTAAGYTAQSVTVRGTEDNAPVDVAHPTDTTYTFTMPAKPVTVEATFTQNVYDIHYPASEGGSVTGPETAAETSRVTLTVTPDTGYRVVRVTLNTNQTLNPPYEFDMPGEPVTVEAQFEKQSYNISYVSNPTDGGTVSSEGNLTTAVMGTEIKLTAAANSGYNFSGFTVTGDETRSAVSLTNGNAFVMPPENVTVTGQFAGNQVTVTFSENHGDIPGTLVVPVTPGQPVAPPEEVPAWDNHTFAGWFTTPDATTPFDFPNTPINADTTIYAGWDVTLTFNGNGGAPETQDVPARVGSTVAAPETNPTREGYEFTGWFTTPDATTKVDFPVTATESKTFYAGWARVITVEYKCEVSNGGGIDGPATVKPGETVTVKATPASSDFTFKDLTVTIDGADTTVTEDEYTFDVPDNATSVKVTATFSGANGGGSGSGSGGNGGGDGGGCYIATSVYGSYDTPEVWTLRRFRDDVLGQTWYGRLFIKAYYATSPTLVRWFGDTEWFQNFWRDKLDSLVDNLQEEGFESTPYQDKDW